MAFGNGVNLQPSYYNGGDVDFAWDLMKTLKNKTNIKTLRIEIEWYMRAEARGWIQQACCRGFDVIATYHNSDVLDRQNKTKKENPDDLMDAAKWWADNFENLRSAPILHRVKVGDTLGSIAEKYFNDAAKAKLILHANASLLSSARSGTPKMVLPKLGSSLAKPPFTAPGLMDSTQNLTSLRPDQMLTIPTTPRPFSINLMNEWGSPSLSPGQYAANYNKAIKIVRDVYSGPMIIDLSGSGQETAVAVMAATGYNVDDVKIDDPNIVFSVHIYKDAYVTQKPGSSKSREGWLETADLDHLAKAGRPCIVGEFGEGKASGGANWSALVMHAKKRHGWPVLGWAWNGDGGAMNMINPSWAASPGSAAQSQGTPKPWATSYYHSIEALLDLLK